MVVDPSKANYCRKIDGSFYNDSKTLIDRLLGKIPIHSDIGAYCYFSQLIPLAKTPFSLAIQSKMLINVMLMSTYLIKSD